MWTAWQRDWFARNLTPEQESKKWSKKTSLFNAWAWTTVHVGGKDFVMAVWQTGMTWAPSSDLVRKDFEGALKHVATHFASWTRKLARSVANHKADPRTEEARTRSGTSKGHGLNPQQVQDRAERTDARHNYYRILRLDHKFCASKGKGKGKRRGAAEHSVQKTAETKAWANMSRVQQWWLKQLWNGRLLKSMKTAESKCHRVQAPRFRVPLDMEP